MTDLWLREIDRDELVRKIVDGVVQALKLMQCRLDHALLTEQHDGDIPAPEWIAFGDRDQKIDRVVYLLHHSDDEHPDRFYQMNEQMTVFGFGRQAFTNI